MGNTKQKATFNTWVKKFQQMNLEIFIHLNIEFDFSCKLSPKKTTYMKCQTIFWEKYEKKKKKIKQQQKSISLSSAEFAHITKTCLYNIDPLQPHFYIVKLGFTGVYIIFLISAQNIDCGYLLEPPRWGGSNEYPQSMFWAGIWKIFAFFIWKFSCFCEEIFNIFE